MRGLSVLRGFAIQGAASLGLLRLVRGLRPRSVSVLCYHGFVDDERRAQGRYAYLFRNSLSVGRLEEHLAFLRRTHAILSPADFLAILEGDAAPARGVLVTLDDGCRSAFDLALPVLHAHGVHAILLAPTAGVTRASAGLPWFQWHERLAALLLTDATPSRRTWPKLREFLPGLSREPRPYTLPLLAELEQAAWSLSAQARQQLLDQLHSLVGRDPDPDELRYRDGAGTVLDLMTWDQLGAARDLGMEVGSHTVSHAKLSVLSERELEYEVVESGAEIRAQLGAPCRFFSMPYDQVTERHPQYEQVLAKSGYRAAFFQGRHPASLGNPLHVGRIGIPPACSVARLEFYLSDVRGVVQRTAAKLRSSLRLPERGLATGAAWMLGAQGIRLLAQVVYFVLLARRLGAAGYGAFAGALGAISLMVPFAGMGAGSFLIRGVTRGVHTPDHWWGRAVLTVVRGGAVLALGVIALGWLLLHDRIPFWLLVGVTVSDIMLLPLIEVSGQAFQALDRLDRTALIWVVWSGLKVAAAVTLTIVPGGNLSLWAVLYPLSTGGAALVAVRAVTRRVGWPPRPTSFGRAELREGLMFSLSGSARSIYDDIDKAMLARLGSLGVTGIYGAAYRIIDVAFLPVRSLVFAAYPRFFARGAAGVRAAAALARSLVPAAGAYGLVAGVALFVLAPLVPIVLGGSFAGVGAAIRWLAILPLLRAMHYFAADALTGAGHQGLRTTAQIGVAVLNVCLNLFLIPAYSWIGAAWASLLSDGVLAISLWLILHVLAHRAVRRNAIPVVPSLAEES
jgi:O-antigen/teichoic acid export membrane protein/peptidoglycan/xylan/chitin deacetylase (PgdA/CDA1 family)